MRAGTGNKKFLLCGPTLIAFCLNNKFIYPCLMNYCFQDSTLLIFLSMSFRANAMSMQYDMVESDDVNLVYQKDVKLGQCSNIDGIISHVTCMTSFLTLLGGYH